MIQTAGRAIQLGTVGNADRRVIGEVRHSVITGDGRALDRIGSAGFAECHAGMTAGQRLRHGDAIQRQSRISADGASLTRRESAVRKRHFRVIHQRIAVCTRSVRRHRPSAGQSLSAQIQCDSLVDTDRLIDRHILKQRNGIASLGSCDGFVQSIIALGAIDLGNSRATHAICAVCVLLCEIAFFEEAIGNGLVERAAGNLEVVGGALADTAENALPRHLVDEVAAADSGDSLVALHHAGRNDLRVIPTASRC